MGADNGSASLVKIAINEQVKSVMNTLQLKSGEPFGGRKKKLVSAGPDSGPDEGKLLKYSINRQLEASCRC